MLIYQSFNFEYFAGHFSVPHITLEFEKKIWLYNR